MKRKFKLTLAILEPKLNIVIDFRAENLTNDIMSARDDFNIYHKGAQKLEIKAIEKAMILVELEIKEPENNQIELYRKISLFSRRLYNKYGWKQYSNLPGRLLTIVSSEEITVSQEVVEANTNEKTIEDVRVEAEGMNMQRERLRYLYAKKRYVDLQIQELEQKGVTLD